MTATSGTIIRVFPWLTILEFTGLQSYCQNKDAANETQNHLQIPINTQDFHATFQIVSPMQLPKPATNV